MTLGATGTIGTTAGPNLRPNAALDGAGVRRDTPEFDAASPRVPEVAGLENDVNAGSSENPSGDASRDSVEVSPEGRRAAAEGGDAAEGGRTESNDETRGDAVESAGDEEESEDPNELTESELELIERLEARDREVRAHEQAHLSAAGDLAKGPPSYDYQVGPDNKRYAVGGSVQIDTSKGRTPQETITKAERIKRAALAPAEPSTTDRNVAAKADRLKAEARQELRTEQAEENEAAAQERREALEEAAPNADETSGGDDNSAGGEAGSRRSGAENGLSSIGDGNSDSGPDIEIAANTGATSGPSVETFAAGGSVEAGVGSASGGFNPFSQGEDQNRPGSLFSLIA